MHLLVRIPLDPLPGPWYGASMRTNEVVMHSLLTSLGSDFAYFERYCEEFIPENINEDRYIKSLRWVLKEFKRNFLINSLNKLGAEDAELLVKEELGETIQEGNVIYVDFRKAANG